MLLSLKQIFLEYSDRIILNNIDFNIDDNDKIALIGINGMGKSSLLKIVKNYLDLPSENYHAKNNLKIGYLDQETSYFETDDILAYVCSNKLNSENEYLAKSILNKLDINDYSLNLNNLSGGQKKTCCFSKSSS